MASRTLRIGILAGAGLLLVALGVVLAVTHKHNRLSDSDVMTANWVSTHGVATRDDYIRTVRLQDSAGNGNPLTEQDADWLLAFASDPHYQGANLSRRRMYACGPFIFSSLERLPAALRDRIYDFGLSMIHDADPDNHLAGCRILGRLKDKRAIPELQALRRSGDKETVRFAEDALDRDAGRPCRHLGSCCHLVPGFFLSAGKRAADVVRLESEAVGACHPRLRSGQR